MKSLIGSFIGLVLGVGVGAEPLLEGRVRLSSGQPAAGVQVRLFDLTDLRRFVGTTTDEIGHFALPLRAFSTVRVPARPTDFALGQNYPNPFNPSTIIPYQLPAVGHVRLEVFNLLGQRLATLVDAERSEGAHTALWDATDAVGRAVGAGVYIYRLSSGGQTVSRRMVLVDGQAGIPAAGAVSGPVRSAVESAEAADELVYGLTVAGMGLIPYVNPAFQVGIDEVDIVVEEHGGARMKLAAGGVLGDVNGDGLVDVADVLFVLLYSMNPAIMFPNNGDISRGDVNGDGLINVADAELLLRYLSDPFDPALPPGIGLETDDTLAGATEVSLGSSTAGSLSEEDVDYFRVEMSGSGTLTAYTTGDYTNTEGAILDSSGTVLALGSDSGDGYNFRVSVPVSSGTYYIKVGTAYSSERTIDYTLYVVGPLDFAVAASVSDSTLAFGQPFTLRATVHNQGGGESEPTVLFYYTSTDTTITSDDTQISADVASLEDSDTITKSISLTAPEQAGTYYYGACVQSVSGEHNANNNCSEAVRVTVSSDFVYTPSALSHIYWTDSIRGTIHRANVDGSNIETLITGLRRPRGIALDVAGGQMYWTDYDHYRDDTGTIHRANVDGSNIETLVIGLRSPEGIALDMVGGKVYWMDWIDWDWQGRYRIMIHLADMDDFSFGTLFSSIIWGSPGGIALDVAGGKMYI
ncbi:MAG: T9SS type A sorting domain-containing protein [Gemmatimonadetes bacterium]|nr:T9SS type A sorting domain-containing protein [Gemmatimonadota bacterium]